MPTTTYTTFDGEHFPTYEEAVAHEQRLELIEVIAATPSVYLQRYEKDALADQLLKEYKLERIVPEPVC